MSQAIPNEVQRQIDQMTEGFRQRLTTLYEWSNGERGDEGPNAVEIEDAVDIGETDGAGHGMAGGID